VHDPIGITNNSNKVTLEFLEPCCNEDWDEANKIMQSNVLVLLCKIDKLTLLIKEEEFRLLVVSTTDSLMWPIITTHEAEEEEE